MIKKLRDRANSESGFTLVELLVVMLIIGLLAAIAIPSFFNQRDKARDADAKSSVKTAQTAMETYATDNGGSYLGATAGTTTSALNKIEPTLNDAGTRLSVVSATANTYEVKVMSESAPTTQGFSIARASNGTVTYPCTVAGTGGCPTGTQGWGG